VDSALDGSRRHARHLRRQLSGDIGGAPDEALFKLFPLDSFVDHPIAHMQVVGKPDERLPIHEEFKAAADRAEAGDIGMTSIERHAFYDAARQAYAVVQTSEERPYGCFIVTKGVIFD
jgi:L-fucose mutarotase